MSVLTTGSPRTASQLRDIMRAWDRRDNPVTYMEVTREEAEAAAEEALVEAVRSSDRNLAASANCFLIRNGMRRCGSSQP